MMKKLLGLALVMGLCFGLTPMASAVIVDAADDGSYYMYQWHMHDDWVGTVDTIYGACPGFTRFDIENDLAGYTSDQIVDAKFTFDIIDISVMGMWSSYPIGTLGQMDIHAYNTVGLGGTDPLYMTEGYDGGGDIPGYASDPISYTHIATGYPEQVQIDITGIVKDWLDYANGAGGYYNNGIEIFDAVSGDNYGWYWNSREAGIGGKPRLDVNVVPEPGSWMLLGTGLVGLVGFSRKRRKV